MSAIYPSSSSSAGAGAIVYAGYGWELLMLWIVPTRISSFLFVFVFSYLTHQPFETLARENEYKATALRLGADWFWSPVMANHNYHLLHHLYPSAPFYVYQRMWKLKGEEILRVTPVVPANMGPLKACGDRACVARAAGFHKFSGRRKK